MPSRTAPPAYSAPRSTTACITLDADLNQMTRGLQAWNEQQFGVITLSPIHGILAAALDSLEHYPQLTIPVDSPRSTSSAPAPQPWPCPNPCSKNPCQS